jgi:hypothetical protein
VATTIEQLRQRVQLERQLIARLKTANIRFTDAQVERIWAIVLSPSSWPIDSQNRWRDRIELESNSPTSQRARSQGDSKSG